MTRSRVAIRSPARIPTWYAMPSRVHRTRSMSESGPSSQRTTSAPSMRAELVDCVNRSATALRLTEQRLRAAVHVHLELERRVVVAVQKWAEAEGVHDGGGVAFALFREAR